MQEFITLFNAFGPWGGMVITVAILYSRRYIATGRELDQLQKYCDGQETKHERERTELRQEITFWRDIAWSNSRIADQVAGALPVRKEPT